MIAIPFSWYCTRLFQPVSNTDPSDEGYQELRAVSPQPLSFSLLALLVRFYDSVYRICGRVFCVILPAREDFKIPDVGAFAYGSLDDSLPLTICFYC